MLKNPTKHAIDTQQAHLFFLLETFNNYIISIEIVNENEIRLNLKNASDLPFVIALLKNSLGFSFTQLLDITASDFTTNSNAYKLYYSLLNSKRNLRYLLCLYIDVDNAIIPSIHHVYPSSGWLEREVWDMFGIFFTSHNDLKRILTDYGFTGHPLKKSFPITGYVQTRYDDILKRVVIEPVNLVQDFRLFNYNLVWEKLKK